jgi:hypothetical protein
VATLEPTIALETMENALRRLIAYVHREKHGPNWLDRISTPDQRAGWVQRAETEKQKRKGVVVVPGPGLDYAQFYELLAFAEKHWEPLTPALGKKASVYPLLERFEVLRDTVAHHRALVTYEREQYSGIAGQIRNQVAKFMSTQDEAGNYFPYIESIVDGHGFTFSGNPKTPEAGPFPVDATVTVHPGEVVTFTCIGIDPQDRELEWEVSTTAQLLIGGKRQSTGGQPVELNWNISATEVSPKQYVLITMRAVGAEYHRFGQHDQQIMFTYKVRPPNM